MVTAWAVVTGLSVASGPSPFFSVVAGAGTVGSDAATFPFPVVTGPVVPVTAFVVGAAATVLAVPVLTVVTFGIVVVTPAAGFSLMVDAELAVVAALAHAPRPSTTAVTAVAVITVR